MEQFKYGLKLVPDEEAAGYLLLESNPRYHQLDRRTSVISVRNPSDLSVYFDGIEVVKPDPICRPVGNTTYFTTAGIQQIETIQGNTGNLDPRRFVVAQPVIRSQYLDKVKDGVSTAFVNFSVVSIYSSTEEYVDLSRKLISLVLDQGADFSKLKFQIEDVPDKWGDRVFTKKVFTLYSNEVEIGECVYIPDYPNKDEKVAITDVCLGVERLMWGLGKSKYYFSEFSELYEGSSDSNSVTATIDCIRTSVLIAGEGVIPSHKDPGYRLRQLIKTFVARNKTTGFAVDDLIDISYEHWLQYDMRPTIAKESVSAVIKTEIDRSLNVLILATLRERSGSHFNMNVNQPLDSFLKQFKRSVPRQKQALLDDILDK